LGRAFKITNWVCSVDNFPNRLGVGCRLNGPDLYSLSPFLHISVANDCVGFVGPIAKQIGEHGADLGLWTGFGWALVCFPPLRWLELKKIGR